MKNEGAPECVFSGMTESIESDPVVTSCKPGPESRYPVGPGPGYRTRRKVHALPIVRDEFRPAIPRRVARQHCPSPLHRHHQLKIIAASKEMIYHRTVYSVLTVCLTHRDKPRKTTIRLSGHFQSEHIDELKKQIEENGPSFVLDLKEVTLVDVAVVRFLRVCEAGGMKIVHCSQYIREWMTRERLA